MKKLIQLINTGRFLRGIECLRSVFEIRLNNLRICWYRVLGGSEKVFEKVDTVNKYW